MSLVGLLSSPSQSWRAGIDLPLPTLFLASLGALVLLRQAYSILRLIAEMTIIPGTNVRLYHPGSGSANDRSKRSRIGNRNRGLWLRVLLLVSEPNSRSNLPRRDSMSFWLEGGKVLLKRLPTRSVSPSFFHKCRMKTHNQLPNTRSRPK